MRRYSALSSLLAIIMLFLVACGNSSAGSGKVTINWWHINTGDPLKTDWQNLANQYMQSHPNVTIKVSAIGAGTPYDTKLAAQLQAGTPPDIFQSWGGGGMQSYAKAGLLKDITADVQSGGWGDTFSPAALNLYKYNGKYYGVPWDIGAVGFWYNPDLFTKAGITGTPATWDDFVNDIKLLKAANITPISLGEKDAWTGAFYWEYLAIRLGGKAAFDKAYGGGGSFADPTFVQAGQYLQQLVALHPFENGFLGASYGDHQALMGNGKAAMELMGQWGPTNDAASSTDKKGQALKFFPFPAIPSGAGDPTDVLGGGNGFAIGKNAPKETIDFVKFLTSATNQTIIAGQPGAPLLPPVKAASSAVTDPNALAVVQLVQKANYFQLYYDQFLPSSVGPSINTAVQGIFAGTSTPDATAQAISTAVASSK